MTGIVFVYNLFHEAAALHLNGGEAMSPPADQVPKKATGPILGLAGPARGYLPSCVAVGSAKHSDESSGFVYRGSDGLNTMMLIWDSGIGIIEVNMPTFGDDVSIDDNLICYISIHKLSVYDTKGFLKREGDVVFKPTS